MSRIVRVAVATALAAACCYAAKAPFTFEVMSKLARIAEPQLSPDGKWVAFSVAKLDLAANAKPTQVYVAPADGSSAPRQLTSEGGSNLDPRWSPDSKHLYFVSDRKDGKQIWRMNADGTGQQQLTSLPTGAEGLVLSPDGLTLLFTSDVYPACAAADAKPGVLYDATCNKEKADKQAASKMHARVYTSLLYRRWTAYRGSTRQHLLVQSASGTGPVRDLTPGNIDVPPFSLGGPAGFGFSPDASTVVYVANTDSDLATSTNSDLFAVPVAGGEAKRLTENPGADEGPVYSPDGKYIAFRTQARPGFESDIWRLAIFDISTGEIKTLTDSLDQWVESYAWSADSQRIFFTIDDHGTNPLLTIPAGGGQIRSMEHGPGTWSDVQLSPDGKSMIYIEESGERPAEIYRAQSDGRHAMALTHLNDGLFEQYATTPLESLMTNSKDGTPIQSFIVKPPDFDASKKYPALMMIHGGPQGAWGEDWSYRWNPQVFAAAGFVVVMPNPRGSIGYGQAFTNAVSGDWGGKPYDDIMAVTDQVAELPFVDKDRMVAAGGSYGGYLVDWILGHTDRFKALISHAGVYDLRSEAGTTEELWFPKWEFKGFPWQNPELYEKWSPSTYAKNFKTPTLVMHGELDYRVPIGQGQQLFTALQEQHVPSKLVQFPEEGHWILKPQDSQFWYRTFIDWITQYTRRP